MIRRLGRAGNHGCRARVGQRRLPAERGEGKAGLRRRFIPKCKVCHSIGGKGKANNSIGGSTLKADDIKAWLRTPKESAEKAKAARRPPMPAYPKEKLSDADLDALAAYLLTLKKYGPASAGHRSWRRADERRRLP